MVSNSGELPLPPLDPDACKEVYALFGLAYYLSECLHRGLCFLFVLGTFQSASGITRPRFEEKLEHAFGLTMGQLLSEVGPLVSSDLVTQVRLALNKRNYLAHHFWYERIHMLYSQSGVESLCTELTDQTTLFETLTVNVNALVVVAMDSLGLPRSLLTAGIDRVLSGNDLTPLRVQRDLRKSERLVKAWDVPGPSEQTALVFETQDGSLWQLCDVGLGWTYHTHPMPDWRLNVKLQRFLPTTITPRPQLVEPWQYEWPLKDGVVLWIKKEKNQSLYTWGLRTACASKMSRQPTRGRR